MSTLYRKIVVSKEAFRIQVFQKFIEAVGGDLDEFTDVVYSKYIVEDFAYSDDSYWWGVVGYFQNVVVPHKIAVYQAGMELLRHDWSSILSFNKDTFKDNLWLHDISKFCANESFGYAGYNRKTGAGKAGFEKAWHHHKMHNEHHPEYWINPSKDGSPNLLEMRDIYILEMVADWIGAGRTYDSSLQEWLPSNIHKFIFAEDTRLKLRGILERLGFDCEVKGQSLEFKSLIESNIIV